MRATVFIGLVFLDIFAFFPLAHAAGRSTFERAARVGSGRALLARAGTLHASLATQPGLPPPAGTAAGEPVPCGTQDIDSPETLPGVGINVTEHEATRNQAHPTALPQAPPGPTIRTEYDRCVFDELESRPPSETTGFARVCYSDCLKSRATFAPRMCHRLCTNALGLKFAGTALDPGAACAQLCPQAAFSLGMTDGFCPPLPPTVSPAPRPVAPTVAAATTAPTTAAPAAAPGPAPAPAPGPGLPHLHTTEDESPYLDREFVNTSTPWTNASGKPTVDGRLFDNAT